MTKEPVTGTGILATCIPGPQGTGKTSTLLEKVCAMLDAGCPAERIAFFAASPQAAAQAKQRLQTLAQLRSADWSGVYVSIPRDYALQILATDWAHAATGRKARVLSPIEEKVLLRDLEVSGIRAGRIRSMMGFFSRSLTELADDDSNWLQGAEEDILYTLLQSNLQFLEGALETEISNLARKAVLQAKRQPAFDHVFVDDYQLLSRASQQLCCLAARRSICVSADPDGCVKAHEAYPYAKGVEEFREAFPQADVVTLSMSFHAKAIQDALVSLRRREGLESLPSHSGEAVSEGHVDFIMCESPEQEFSTVAERVAKAKRDDGQFDVVVAAPNTRWAEELASALRSAGVSSFVHPAIHPWNTDPTTGKTQLPKLLCGLRLIADPKDAPAWRVWCGFGDSMANSPAFNGIRKAAEERGLSLVEALEALSAGTLSLERGSIGANRVVDAYFAGIELCRKAQGLRGAKLLDCITGCIRDDERATAPESFVRLCGVDDATSPEQPDARTMLARFCSSFDAPLPCKNGAVPVLTYREVIGTNAETLIVTGFVNGFTPGGDWFDLTKTPSAKQPQYRLDCARTVAALVGSAQSELIFTGFSGTELETASALGLKIDRIHMIGGKRMAAISPSIFLDSLLDCEQNG